MFTSLLVTLVVSQATPSWDDVDHLSATGRVTEALAATEQRLAAARAANDDDERVRALVRRLALRSNMGLPEVAARELRAEPLPDAAVPRAITQAFAAFALEHYAESWDVARREKIVTTAALDVKQLTRAQLWDEVEQRYLDLWSRREALGATSLASLGDYIGANTFPPGVRDTLRDFVSLALARWLANERHWSSEQRNERSRLALDQLLGTGVDMTPASHPLLRAVAVLDDLERWHQRRGQPEGALFARVERLQRLWSTVGDAPRRPRLRDALLARLAADASLPLSAWGRLVAARWLRDGGELVKARDLAAQGAAAFPQSPGGAGCRRFVAELEAPAFSLQSMTGDGPNKRSLTVSSMNLPKLYFRAFAVDVESLVGGRRGQVMPWGDDLRPTLKRTPVASWAVDLPPTPDLASHDTHVTPPPLPSGAYVVAASANESFVDRDNRIVGALFVVTSLVLTTATSGDRADVVVRDGATGAPVEGAEVRAMSLEFGQRSHVISRVTTNREGLATLGGRGEGRFVIAKKGRDLAIDPGHATFWGGEVPLASQAALISTDRAIYRPAQALKWKVVAYASPAVGHDLRVLPRSALTVRLLDANGEQVASARVTTNDFGSASGEFTIPVGRQLGEWSLEAKDSTTSVRVEEYKRPTFEVSFQDTGAALKLNAPARLHGEARYYFGLPVTAGKVSWRVHREPVYPWWLSRWSPPASRQLVASGLATLDASGAFDLDFTPTVDPATSREVSWSYTAEADVTEDGGETRSAQRTVRLGVVSVQAAFERGHEFVGANEPSTVRVKRTSLDGDGRAGAGRWRLVSLVQPAAPVLWADEPIEPSPFAQPAAVVTPGDSLRPRARAVADVDATLRRWADGAPVASGSVTHDAAGVGRVQLPALRPGAYRLHYETADEAGAPLSMSTEVVVAADTFPLAVPGWLSAEHPEVEVGSTARFLVGSGFAGQPLLYEVLREGRVLERRWLTAGKETAVIERPVTRADRGGFSVRVSMVRDWQVATFTQTITVPWTDKALSVAFATMRDTLRPGSTELFTVTVKSPAGPLEARSVELLASMYDKALEAFAPFSPVSVAELYPQQVSPLEVSSSVGLAAAHELSQEEWYTLPAAVDFIEDGPGRLGVSLEGAGFEGGQRFRALEHKRFSTIQVIRGSRTAAAPGELQATASEDAAPPPPPPPPPSAQVRAHFAETAFFAPHLLLGDRGEVRFEVPVPESVTAWNLWVSALTKDLRGGFASATVRSVKELMVRPALPRFLREGDAAVLKIVVNNASAKDLAGQARLELFDPETSADRLADFGVSTAVLPWSAKAGQSTTVTVPLRAPRGVGEVAVKVVATAGELSDGELRTLPLLPSRLRLAQSRFVALKDAQPRTLSFSALTGTPDPTRVDEQLVVTVDAQLFTSVLSALPFLVRSPYECTEQTLNRFLSTSLVASVFRETPALASLAAAVAKRKTPYEPFDALDPNRKARFEETPWAVEAKGGDAQLGVNLLEPAALEAERTSALRKLQTMQLESGAFSWFPGGQPSPAMTLYVVEGFARAAQAKVDVPRPMVARAWSFVVAESRAELARCAAKDDCSLEFLTPLVHAASAFPDASWLGAALPDAERRALLDLSFRHWRGQSLYLRAMLALALKRDHRDADATVVFDSVMNLATTTPDEGTFWQPEPSAWLWYHDTVEGHAFALRALTELSPKDPRRDGLAQWLVLNKKLNHWKSTRATAEAIFALVTYLRGEKVLGLTESSTVTVGPVTRQLTFDAAAASARTQRLVLAGKDLDPATMSTVTVSKPGKGLQFASATWHFSTDRLPEKGDGDLFAVTRTYFKRVQQGPEVTLQPLREGARLEPGDELEVQLAIRAKQAAEYVHLRDPRGAGFEPSVALSRSQYDLGLWWYEEVRDSATNFFFERVPAGTYTLKYRVRAAMGGTFRVGPATLQSMYAPEFTAYSAGHELVVGAGGR